MAILPIRLYPDPILRERCRPVVDFDAALRSLVEDMFETMAAAPGIGLAAPQIGRDLRLAVVDLSAGEDVDQRIVLVNPTIVLQDGRNLDVEGCLSIPGLTDKVARPDSVRLQAQDLHGKRLEMDAEDLLARAICHEIDHLDGVLFTDHLRGLRREKARRHLRRLQEEGVEEVTE